MLSLNNELLYYYIDKKNTLKHCFCRNDTYTS